MECQKAFLNLVWKFDSVKIKEIFLNTKRGSQINFSIFSKYIFSMEKTIVDLIKNISSRATKCGFLRNILSRTKLGEFLKNIFSWIF